LTDVLVNGYGWGSFFVGLASFGNLNFSFLRVGWRNMPIVEINTNDLVHI
jgi:hypothetical protein